MTSGVTFFNPALEIIFPPEIIDLIFSECLSASRYEDLSRLSRVNVFWNQYWEVFSRTLKLEQHYPELDILDAKAQGIAVDDEPPINKLAVLAFFQKLAPHVENKESLTLLTMCKGITLINLVKIAGDIGIKIKFIVDTILERLGDESTLQTYRVLVTNNIFLSSRYQTRQTHVRNAVMKDCELPTLREYVTLCVFAKKVFNKNLYPDFGRSSTQMDCYDVIVGNFHSDELEVDTIPYFCCQQNHGAGGRKTTRIPR